MARQNCPACKGRRLKPEALAVSFGGSKHRRLHRALGDRGDRGVPHGRPHTDRADHRRAGAQGDPRAPAVPRGRRPRLPDARARGGLALRRRGAAHPARDPDRLAAGRRALRAGRADHRPAPARQRPAPRHAQAPARPGQHGAGRRARRGDDLGGGLRRSIWAPAPASTAAHLVAEGTPGEIVRHPDSLTGKYLSGRLSIPVPAPRRSGGEVAAPASARAATTSRGSTSTSRSGR